MRWFRTEDENGAWKAQVEDLVRRVAKIEMALNRAYALHKCDGEDCAMCALTEAFNPVGKLGIRTGFGGGLMGGKRVSP